MQDRDSECGRPEEVRAMNKFDRIGASVPVNRSAALVTSKGVHYEPDFSPPAQFWDIAPPTIKVPWNATSIVGLKSGRLVVIGYLGRTGTGARWLVHCACGKFEGRRTRTLTNPKIEDDCCHLCNYQKRVKHNYEKGRLE